jgi:transcriptional regulator with XRE-family HTH domain
LSFTYISDIERGTRNISLDSLEKIIQALDIRPAELFDFPDDSDNGDFNDKRLLIESLKSLLMERRVEEIQFIHKVAREFVNTVDQTNNEHRPYIGKK